MMPPAHSQSRIDAAWRAYGDAPMSLKHRAKCRADAVLILEKLLSLGLTAALAQNIVAMSVRKMGAPGGSVQSLRRWAKTVRGAPINAWPALLLPAYRGRTAIATCDPQAWDWYRSRVATGDKLDQAAAYRDLQVAAGANGWTIPSARTMARRLSREAGNVIIPRSGSAQ